MKIFVLVAAVLHSLAAFSQTDTSAPYWKDRSLPQFSLMKQDSSRFTNAGLDSTKQTIIMLFNPECEHCQDQYKLLVSIPEVIAKAQIIMSSTETMEKMGIFAKKFMVAKYPFVQLAKDDQYTFGRIYQPKTIPVLVFYNKQRKFVAIKQGSASKKEILSWLKP